MPFATWRDKHTEEHTMDAREHRIQLGQAAAAQLTQYLHTLSADAWHHPSACAGWEVCDVVEPSGLGGGILREHGRQRGARRHGATSRRAPSWGAGAGGRLGIQRPARDCVSGTSGRSIACHLHGTDCSVLPTPAAPRPAGLGETLLSSPRAPPGTAVYHHAANRTGDARLGYPVCARPHSRTVSRQPPGFYGTGSRDRVAPPHAARRTATGAPALSLYGDWGRAEPVRPAHDSGPGAAGTGGSEDRKSTR